MSHLARRDTTHTRHDAGLAWRLGPSGCPSPLDALARRSLPLLLPALTLLLTATAVRAQGPVFSLEGDFYPGSELAKSMVGPVTEAEVAVVRGQMGPLFAIGRRPTLIAPSISGSFVYISTSPREPAADEPVKHLYDLDLNVTLLRFLSPRWLLAVTASPGIASDFEHIDAGQLTIQGATVVTKIVKPTFSWSVGAALTNAFGEILALPILGLGWRSPIARADVLAPDRGELVLMLGSMLELGVSADLDGNIYTLGRGGELHDAIVRYSVIDFGPIVNLKLTPGVQVSLAGGASLNRRLEIENEEGRLIQDAELVNGAYLEVGLCVYPPSR